MDLSLRLNNLQKKICNSLPVEDHELNYLSG